MTTANVPASLDGELWSTLSEEIVFSILAWLPLKDSARFKTVCKKWENMWSCPVFLSVRCRAPPEKCLLIFNRLEHLRFMDSFRRLDTPNLRSLCFNPGLNKWHILKFHYLPSPIERVAATAGGLLLCLTRPGVMKTSRAASFCYWPEMFVCNPLKQNSCNRLPNRECNWKPHMIGMVVGPEAGAYKVILATVHQGTEIYDSNTKCWKLLESCRPPGPAYHDEEAISHNGSLFCMGKGAMFVFDVARELWGAYRLPYSARAIQYTQLYDCSGRLMLVACLRSGKAVGKEERMFVWEAVIDLSEGMVWKLLSSVATKDVQEPYNPDAVGHGGNEDLLFVHYLNITNSQHVSGLTSNAKPQDSGQEKAFLFNPSQNAWYSVNERPAYPKRLLTYQGNALRYEPKL